MAKKVENKDLFAADLMGKTIKDVELLIVELDKLEAKIVTVAKAQKTILAKEDNKTIGSIQRTTKAVNQLSEAEKIQQTLLKQKQTLDTKLKAARTVQAQQNAENNLLLQQQNKIIKEAARENLGLTNAYTKLTGATNKAQAEFKRLAAEFGVNSKQANAARLKFEQLDNKLRQVNNAARDGRRDVGRYGLALDKVGGFLRSGLGALGITAVIAGVARVFLDAAETVRKFDESIADLRKTTGLGDESARKLAKSLTTIDTRSSVFELVELATAAGRLGIAEKDIKDFVEQADKLFVALGDDLGGTAEEIATSIGKISSVFGVEAAEGVGEGLNKIGSVINELAGSTKANAGNILDFTNRLAGIAPAANISVQNVAGLAATLDSFGQSMEVGSSALSKLIPEIGKDLPKFAKLAGVSVEEFSKILNTDGNEALLRVLEGAKSTKGGIEGLTQTLGNLGVDSARAAGVVGVLSNNIDEVRKNQKLANEAFEEGVSLTNEFNIKNQTLDASIDKLGNSYDKFILSLENGSGAISKATKFVVNMLQTFIGSLTDFNDGNFTRAWQGYVDAYTGGATNLVGAYDLMIAAQDKFIDRLRKENLETIKSEKVRNALIHALVESGASAEEAAQKYIELVKEKMNEIKANKSVVDSTNLVVESTKRTVAVIEAEISAQQKLLKEQSDRKGHKAIEDKIKILEREKEAITGSTKSKKDALKTEKDLKKAEEDALKIANERLKILDDLEIRNIEDKFLKEKALRQQQFEEQIADLEKRGVLTAEIEKELKQELINDLADIDKKEVEERLEREKKADNDRFEIEKKQIEEEARIRKELTEAGLQVIEDLVNNYYDKQLKALDKQLEKTGERVDFLREKAKNSMLASEESLAFEQKKEAELEQQRIKTQQQQQRIQALMTVISTYNAKVNANDPTPLQSTIRDLGVLRALAGTLQGFYDGTDDVGKSLGKPQLKGKDGHIVRVDGKEQIWSEKDRKAVGYRDRDEIKGIVSIFDSGVLDEIMKYDKSNEVINPSAFAMNGMSLKMISKLEQISENIKGIQIPEGTVNIDEVRKLITLTTKKGNRIKKERSKLFN